MSEVVRLRSGSDLGSGILKFSDLKNRLEKHFASAKIAADFEYLIGSVNSLVKDHRYSLDERGYFKRLRQRAYDRRRAMCKDEATPSPTPIPSGVPSMQREIEQPATFLAGAKRALSQIDGEHFVQALPATLAIFCFTAFVAGFFWLQSVDLYQSSGFKQPQMAATGALLMVLGFAAYHAIAKSWLALLLCAYIGSYEVYFVVSGTFQDEDQQHLVAIENSPELKLLQENAARAEEAYQLAKSRYDDPVSKVHKNQWYKRATLDIAWAKYQEAQQELLAKKSALENQKDSGHVWLKVFCRLGLVLLCMVLTHRFSEALGGCHQQLGERSDNMLCRPWN